ncbi:pyridoxal 5'-phosphate synthase glutaminase subunit PdxT [Chungangia koreensis]|uniref:Pyridoxal 5'-phosphate synthase subunit PdxT n=1 Tax=Chungangia koreensis TaxID=752657 RepID=A0ABV8X2V2_9LACT
MTVIGVLGLQGAVGEHLKQLQSCGVDAVVVKKAEQLQDIDGLIIPGGESTAIRNLMDRYGFVEPLKSFEQPIFGTCAGMVLLANELSGTEESHLQRINIRVKRNASGRQKDSFEAALEVKGLEEPYHAVFIRAPYVEETGDGVEVLATYDGQVVAAKEGNILVSAFHPELTDDHRFLQLFIDMVNSSKLTVV